MAWNSKVRGDPGGLEQPDGAPYILPHALDILWLAREPWPARPRGA